MGLLYFGILVMLALYVSVQGEDSDCTLEFTQPIPQLLINFGTENLIKQPNKLTRHISETVDIYCASGFLMHRKYYNDRVNKPEKKLNLICTPDGFTTDINYVEESAIDTIQCMDSQIYQLYQSRTHMLDCDSYMSLVVGQNFGELGSLKYLAICYDIAKQRVRYASYTAYPLKTKVLEKTQVGQLNRLKLDIEVTSFESVFNSFNAILENNFELSALLGENTYEFTSLIQDKPLTNELYNFHEMLNVVWLRNLRTGNWKHFLNALDIASLDAKYDVRIGTSGTVTLPAIDKCNETRSVVLELSTGESVIPPAYIWAHIRALQPVENGMDEFVVVAHNSPFITKNEEQQLCTDMCQEVAWLHNSLFIKLHHYVAYGLVQCCRLSDVAHKLDNLPTANENTETAPPPVVAEFRYQTPEMPDSLVDPEEYPQY